MLPSDIEAGQLLNNHVAVETDRNVRRFNREGLRQLQCCLRSRNVLHFNLFQLLHDCSTIAPPPTYAVAMSLYQIIFRYSIGGVHIEYPNTIIIQCSMSNSHTRRSQLQTACCIPALRRPNYPRINAPPVRLW